MHTPDKSELIECKTAASGIVATMDATNWNVSATLPKTSFASARLAGMSITLSAVRGAYNDLSLINGNSGIRIGIPNQKVVPSRVTPTERRDIERVVFGVIVHECTHVIQANAAPAAFAIARTLENRLRALGTNSQPDDWYDLYIGQPFEQEARAGQAAAEVEELGGRNLTQPNFDKLLSTTEVFKRTASRIGAPGNCAPRITNWWQMWAALAWDAYV
jgi:hypothetical protein